MHTNLKLRAALLFLAGPLLAASACGSDSESGDDGSGSACAGAKCDDIDPAEFKCKELRNGSSRQVANVLEDLHDPFADMLKGGDAGCPTNYTDMHNRLQAFDNEGSCAEGGRAGLSSFIITETGQFADAPANETHRAVTSRRCGDRERHEMVFSVFGNGAGGMGQDVEVIAFDRDTQEFNYYAVERGESVFFGSSSDYLKHEGGRCKECHGDGGLVMLESNSPWANWESPGQTPGAKALVDANEELGSKSGGSTMESVVKNGNRAWNETRVGILMNPESGHTVKDLLRPLFCGTQIQMDTAATGQDRAPRDIPTNFFRNCMLNSTSCTGTHEGESGGVKITAEVYDEVLDAVGSRVRGAPGNFKDTPFAMPFVHQGVGDLDYISKLTDAEALDTDFIRDVMMVDLTRPVFSDARCDLLEFAPEWDDLATPVPEPEPEPEPEPDTDSDSGDSDGAVDPAMSDCCEPVEEGEGARTGCEVESVQTCACDNDPFCCETAWDQICVDSLSETCELECSRDGAITAEPSVIKEAKVADLRNAFIANLIAADPAEGSAAAQFLANLQNEEDADSHKERAQAYVDACKARAEEDERGFLMDLMAVVTLQRNNARSLEVFEFQAKLPETDLNPSSSTHFDAGTCELND